MMPLAICVEISGRSIGQQQTRSLSWVAQLPRALEGQLRGQLPG
jgi:hypothetical protein